MEGDDDFAVRSSVKKKSLERGIIMSTKLIRHLLGAVMAMLVIATAAGACAPAPAPTTVKALDYTGVSSTGDTYSFKVHDFITSGGTEYFCLTGYESGRKVQFRVYDGSGSTGTWLRFYNLEGDYSDNVTLGGVSESGAKWSSKIPRGVVIWSDQVSRRVSSKGETCAGARGWFGK